LVESYLLHQSFTLSLTLPVQL